MQVQRGGERPCEIKLTGKMQEIQAAKIHVTSSTAQRRAGV